MAITSMNILTKVFEIGLSQLIRLHHETLPNRKRTVRRVSHSFCFVYVTCHFNAKINYGSCFGTGICEMDFVQNYEYFGDRVKNTFNLSYRFDMRGINQYFSYIIQIKLLIRFHHHQKTFVIIIMHNSLSKNIGTSIVLFSGNRARLSIYIFQQK